jgi:deoxyribodipyrimidine photo-lyase
MVSPFYVYHIQPDARKGLRWRDFFNQLAYHNPKSISKAKPLRLSWKSNAVFSAKLYKKWCEGKTGFHAVDAAMRCLNSTGQISNRRRMLVANFFVKIYNLPWTLGERYFAQTLHDYDVVLNMMNWQWSAGCGVDSVGFRIFNPTTQLNKFDESRAFTSKWLTPKELSTPEDIEFYMKQRKLYLESY